MNDLVAASYEGPTWERFANALASYAYQVIRSWLLTGVIFRRCREKGLGRFMYRGAPPDFQRADLEEIAQDTVVAALGAFRDDVLRPGKWDHTRGATLKTFFVGQCLIKFSSIYRSAAQEHHKRRRRELVVADPSVVGPTTLPGDPVDQVIANDRLDDVRTAVRASKTNAIVALVEEGYGQSEIAEMLDVTLKAVESRLARHRKQLRQEGLA